MKAFKNVISDCELEDLVFWGPKFTWSNCKGEDDLTKEHLDRLVANRTWCLNFHAVDMVIEPALFSDHLPIIMSLHASKKEDVSRRGRFFYDSSWNFLKDCQTLSKGYGNKNLLKRVHGRNFRRRWRGVEWSCKDGKKCR